MIRVPLRRRLQSKCNLFSHPHTNSKSSFIALAFTSKIKRTDFHTRKNFSRKRKKKFQLKEKRIFLLLLVVQNYSLKWVCFFFFCFFVWHFWGLTMLIWIISREFLNNVSRDGLVLGVFGTGLIGQLGVLVQKRRKMLKNCKFWILSSKKFQISMKFAQETPKKDLKCYLNPPYFLPTLDTLNQIQLIRQLRHQQFNQFWICFQ